MEKRKKEMKISVNAPSYKRANEVLTLAYLPFCKVWVDEGEEDEYKEHYPDAEIISCPLPALMHRISCLF